MPRLSRSHRCSARTTHAVTTQCIVRSAHAATHSGQTIARRHQRMFAHSLRPRRAVSAECVTLGHDSIRVSYTHTADRCNRADALHCSSSTSAWRGPSRRRSLRPTPPTARCSPESLRRWSGGSARAPARTTCSRQVPACLTACRCRPFRSVPVLTPPVGLGNSSAALLWHSRQRRRGGGALRCSRWSA